MRFNVRRLAIFGFIIAIVAGLAWYFVYRAQTGTGTPDPSRTAATQPERADQPGTGRRRGGAAQRVVVAAVKVETIGDRVAAVGTGRAVRSLTISAEVAGIIEEMKFSAGQTVKAGEPLVKLKSEAEEIAVKLAQVKIDEAVANLRRYESLRDGVPAIQVQQARTAVALAQAELDAKQYEFRRRTVHAPFGGVMGLTMLGKGDFLQAGAPIATIDDRTSLLVAFVVAERVAGSLTLGQDVRATTPALQGMVVLGKISALDTRIDSASRTMRAEATLPNAQNRLIAGMTFSVSVNIPGEKLPVIPGLAIQWDRNGAFVWQFGADNTVKRIGVTIRRRENDSVAVEAGLKDGDRVVIEGAQGLREGASVTLAPN